MLRVLHLAVGVDEKNIGVLWVHRGDDAIDGVPRKYVLVVVGLTTLTSAPMQLKQMRVRAGRFPIEEAFGEPPQIERPIASG